MRRRDGIRIVGTPDRNRRCISSDLLEPRAQKIVIPWCIDPLILKGSKVVVIVVENLIRIVRLIVPQVRNRLVKPNGSISGIRGGSVHEAFNRDVAVTCVVSGRSGGQYGS